MAWTSKGAGVAMATAIIAAEDGKTDVLQAQSTHTLDRAHARLVYLASAFPAGSRYHVAAERVADVLAGRQSGGAA